MFLLKTVNTSVFSAAVSCQFGSKVVEKRAGRGKVWLFVQETAWYITTETKGQAKNTQSDRFRLRASRNGGDAAVDRELQTDQRRWTEQ